MTTALVEPQVSPAPVSPAVRLLDSLNRIAISLERLTDHLVPEPEAIVGTNYISRKLNVTAIWVTEMARKGLIPRSCIVEGTGWGKPWKFHRREIDTWLKSR